jgi:hypothetical protein
MRSKGQLACSYLFIYLSIYHLIILKCIEVIPQVFILSGIKRLNDLPRLLTTMWPTIVICGHFQVQSSNLHRHTWPLDWLVNYLIQFALANHKYCHLKIQNRNSNKKFMRREKWRLCFSFEVSVTQSFPLTLDFLNIEWSISSCRFF